MATKQKAAKQKRIHAKPAGSFRPGSVRQRVWSALGRKLAGGKRVKLADVAAACRRACPMTEDQAESNAGLLLWNFTRLGLLERIGRGEFAAAKQKKEG